MVIAVQTSGLLAAQRIQQGNQSVPLWVRLRAGAGFETFSLPERDALVTFRCASVRQKAGISRAARIQCVIPRAVCVRQAR
jgi:hypothetical protein